ncbi:MAG: hypothetical protein ACR2PL_00085, partial [Dehalococcoidia bacterium]
MYAVEKGASALRRTGAADERCRPAYSSKTVVTMIDRPSLRPVLTAQPRAGLDRLPQLRLATVGFLLLLVLVVAQAVRGFTDSDYFWHYRAGEYIVTHHAVPHADIFTFSAYGRHWVAHEWLSEALIYSLVKLGGYGLAIVVFTLSPVLAVVLLYRLLEKEGVSARALLPVLVIASLMIAIYTTVRPQVLSWAGFAALFSALYAYHGGRIQRLWGLPPLFALWATLHFSVIVGLGIFGLFALATAGNQWLRKQPFRLGHPLLVLVLSVAAACINPNGPRLLLYPLEYLPLQGTILPAVAEWKSPDFHSYIFLPLLAGVI